MEISVFDFEATRNLRLSIIGNIYNLAEDLGYCATLARTNNAEYGRLNAYIKRRKAALLKEIQEIPNIYLKYSLKFMFVVQFGVASVN